MATQDIYILEHELGPVKIGVATVPEERLQALSWAIPYDVGLRNVIKSDEPTRHERMLHIYYREYRMNGEWFDLPSIEVQKLSQLDRIDCRHRPELKKMLSSMQTTIV